MPLIDCLDCREKVSDSAPACPKCGRLMNKSLPENRSDLLVEYEAAQASAEHHDTLVWSVTSIFWGASFILLGFIVDKITDGNVKTLVLITVLASFGIILCVAVWKIAFGFNRIKNQKYDRCREIEDKFNFTNHINTHKQYSKGIQRCIYSFIMICFIIIWIFVLTWTWACPATIPS
jgi:hypothetical protein